MHLWCKKLLYPTGEEGLFQDAADGRPLSRVPLEQLSQEGAQFLGVVDGHGGV